MNELTDDQKEHFKHQLVGIGNVLQEIGDKHLEYFNVTAEIMAVVCLMAEQMGIINGEDELLQLMNEQPDNKLDIIGDGLKAIVNLLNKSRG